jgi:hypothetical protein
MPRPDAITTSQRGQRARSAVIAYRKAADTNETRDAALLRDLLTDLMHLAGGCGGVSFDRSLELARSEYQAETLRQALEGSREERSAARMV